jgi:hypothetical protein
MTGIFLALVATTGAFLVASVSKPAPTPLVVRRSTDRADGALYSRRRSVRLRHSHSDARLLANQQHQLGVIQAGASSPRSPA